MLDQTTMEAFALTSNDNISVPIGTIRTVRTVFKYLGLDIFLDSLKEKGEPLSYVVESLCTMHLSGCTSMNSWSNACSINDAMKIQMTRGHTISRKTYERALDRLNTNFEEVTQYLNSVLWKMFPDMITDVYVDGSHIPRAGSAGTNVKYGEGGGKIQFQDQFMVAQTISTGLPIMVELYPGNLNDPQQYTDFIPQLMFFLKRGSTIIMDNGGSSKDILDNIVDMGYKYITRKSLNNSDINIIKNEIGRAQYVDWGVVCIESTFDSSGRTNYLFFSIDTFISELYSIDREAEKERIELELARTVIKDKNPSGLIMTKKNKYVKIKVTGFECKVTLDPWTDIDFVEEANRKLELTGGWFKIQSSVRLEPKQVLTMYRHRVTVEHLVSSLKSIVNVKPMRVWNEKNERGALLLGIITQLIISLIRLLMKPVETIKKHDGRVMVVDCKPSYKKICDDLNKWTLTVEFDSGVPNKHESNKFGVCGEIDAILKLMEGGEPIRMGQDDRVYIGPKQLWRLQNFENILATFNGQIVLYQITGGFQNEFNGQLGIFWYFGTAFEP